MAANITYKPTAVFYSDRFSVKDLTLFLLWSHHCGQPGELLFMESTLQYDPGCTLKTNASGVNEGNLIRLKCLSCMRVQG